MRGGSQIRGAGDAFLQCGRCKKVLFRREFEQNLSVCPHCGYHHRISAARRIEITFDEGSFVPHDRELASVDALEFPQYAEKLAQAEAKTGLKDSNQCGMAKLFGRSVSVAVSDFAFMGGSMGSVAGELITRTFERGLRERVPVIVISSSGGARMQEGLLSLMQLPKTLSAVRKCREAGIPYISVVADPTMAGVWASYASVADVILAEPGAMVGFAGARVGKQAQVIRVPDDFQTSEFAYKHGFVDRVVERRLIRPTLSLLIRTLGAHLG